MAGHDDIQALLTDFVLRELSHADQERVEAHLATCAACAADARGLTRAFEGIGLAVAPAAPPVGLRSRVLDSLAPQPRANTSAPALEPRVRRWRASGAVLALAAALVLVLGGLLAVSIQRTARLGEEVRQIAEERARLSTRIAETGAQADLAVSILTATDMRRIDLAGQDGARDATARGYWSASKGLLVVADRLPTPPAGRTFQVWLIGSNSAGPVSAGLLPGEQLGRGMLIVPAPQGVTGTGITIAITDEPRGGLPAPSGTKHLVGSL